MPNKPQNDAAGEIAATSYRKKPAMVARFLRQLRGRYCWAILSGCILAGVGAFVGYVTSYPLYRSNAMLRITPLTLKILYAQNDIVPSIFEGFVDVQVNIMKSRPIIESVLHSPEWLEARGDAAIIEPEVFLRNLEIAHPIRSEIITISYTDRTREGARDGVRMLLKAYLQVHGDRSGNQRMNAQEDRANQLSKRLVELRHNMAEIANEYGTDDLKLLHQTKILELSRLEAMVKETEINLILAEAALGTTDAFKSMPPSEIASSDDILRKLFDEKHHHELRLAELRNYAGEAHPEVLATKSRIAETEAKIDRRAEAFRKFRRASNVNNTGALEGIPTQGAVDSLRDRFKKLQGLLDGSLDRSLEIGRKSLLIANLQEEFRITKERLSEAQNKLDQLRVDSSVVGQINLISEGDLPPLPIKDRRRTMAGGGAVAGFLLGFGLVTAFAFMDRRLKRPSDLAACSVDLPLLGTLPKRNDSAMASRTAASLRQVMAALQIDPELRAVRVLAITSVSDGDGAAGIAAALAIAMACAGRNTLLIDFDLANPTLSRHLMDRQPKMSRAPLGISNVLAGAELEYECIPSGVRNLAVLPWNPSGDEQTPSLSSLKVRDVVRQACDEFEFVILIVGTPDQSLENTLICTAAESTLICVHRTTTDTQLERTVGNLASAQAMVGGVIFDESDAPLGTTELFGDLGRSLMKSFGTRSGKSASPIDIPVQLEVSL